MVTGQAILKNTSGHMYEIVDDPYRYIGEPNVSESYAGFAEYYNPDSGYWEDIECEVYEVYGYDEVPEDYPDGDPYADSLWIAPEGFVFDQEGRLHRD